MKQGTLKCLLSKFERQPKEINKARSGRDLVSFCDAMTNPSNKLGLNFNLNTNPKEIEQQFKVVNKLFWCCLYIPRFNCVITMPYWKNQVIIDLSKHASLLNIPLASQV